MKHPLVLASASSGRRLLLEEVSIDFEVFPADIDESVLDGEGPEELVLRLSELKARSVAPFFPGRYVLAADTVVSAGSSQILGKPRDPEHAQQILEELQGGKHCVHTAFCIFNSEDASTPVLRSSSTEVFVRPMTTAEIRRYVGTREPMGKAGAYSIQGLAKAFISELRGSYTGVVGLPMAELREELQKFGFAEGLE